MPRQLAMLADLLEKTAFFHPSGKAVFSTPSQIIYMILNNKK